MKVELLAKIHDRAAFDCGVEDLNRFLRETARQHIEKGVSRTHVLVDPNSPSRILGFYTLTPCEIATGDLPPNAARRLPDRIGAIRLGRLGVAKSAQGQGFGAVLLSNVVHDASIAADKIGGVGLFVDAKDANAASFYRKYGFIELEPNALQLFLPLKTLLAAASAL